MMLEHLQLPAGRKRKIHRVCGGRRAAASLAQTGDTVPIPERGVTNASNITLSATLPSALPDSLQLQVEALNLRILP